MTEKRFHQFGLWVIDNPNFNGISIADLVDTELMSITEVVELLNEQQATINELQSIINHIKCEENCEDYDYCCETVCSLYNEIKHLKEENEQLRRLFEEMKQPITINLTEEDEKELRKLLGLIDDE